MSDPRDWDLEYDGAAPPLPKLMERKFGARWLPRNLWSLIARWFFPRRKGRGERKWAELVQSLLPTGVYLIWFKPRIAWIETVEPPMVLAGVLRIHHSIKGDKLLTSGSGDLYVCSKEGVHELVRALEPLDERGRLEKLQFPRFDYRYYLRLETLWIRYHGKSRARDEPPPDERVVLGFDTYRFVDGREGWKRRQPITIQVDLKEGRAPEFLDGAENEHPPYPAHTALNSLENHIGDAYLVRVAKRFRRAEIEVHAIEDLYSPGADELNGESLKSYEAMFDRSLGLAGWSVSLVKGRSISRDDDHVPESGEWFQRDLRAYHETYIDGDAVATDAAVPSSRNGDSLRWKYHLLMVDHLRFGEKGRPLGLMYDIDEGGNDELPRQGAAIALNAQTEHEGRPGRLQDFPSLLCKTVLHELGHMQGLYHNPSRRGVMQTRAHLADSFDDEIDAVHAGHDALRLRHLPDQWVRPGGVPFGHRYRPAAVDVFDLIPKSLDLEDVQVEPSTVVVGEGRDLTIHLKLKYMGDSELLVPPTDDISRIGVVLTSPSGSRDELRRILLPKPLVDNTRLLRRDQLTYRVPLGDVLPVLRQAGTYDLEVYLSWAVVYGDSTQRLEVHRTNGVVKLQVSAGGDISRSHGPEESETRKGEPDERVPVSGK